MEDGETKQTKLKIGIDFGGVLIDEKTIGKTVINIPDALEALKFLKKEGHYLVLISFCGRTKAENTRKDIPLQDYFDEIYFVKRKDSKAKICKARGIDVLIDDLQENLDYLTTTKGILFGKKPTFQDKFRAENWNDVLKILSGLKSLNLEKDESIDIFRLIHK